MFFGKRKRAKQALEEAWRSMEMACENNYKDMAQDNLAAFETLLDTYHQEGILKSQEYDRYHSKLEQKKMELRGYDHKQHIGW